MSSDLDGLVLDVILPAISVTRLAAMSQMFGGCQHGGSGACRCRQLALSSMRMCAVLFLVVSILTQTGAAGAQYLQASPPQCTCCIAMMQPSGLPAQLLYRLA